MFKHIQAMFFLMFISSLMFAPFRAPSGPGRMQWDWSWGPWPQVEHISVTLPLVSANSSKSIQTIQPSWNIQCKWQPIVGSRIKFCSELCSPRSSQKQCGQRSIYVTCATKCQSVMNEIIWACLSIPPCSVTTLAPLRPCRWASQACWCRPPEARRQFLAAQALPQFKELTHHRPYSTIYDMFQWLTALLRLHDTSGYY